jgi:hypothetical protein
LLVQARLEDPPQKVMFAEGHWARAEGSGAVVDFDDGNLFLALTLRNVGAGIAVLQGWYVWPRRPTMDDPHPEPDEFRPHVRDMYIPAGDVGMWQGALRDPDDEVRNRVLGVRESREIFAVDLLYTDQVGGQRTISRFAIVPAGEDAWLNNVVRHWNLDGPSARHGSAA